MSLRGTDKGLALTTDCNSRYVYLDPYVGAQYAVAEAARNLACVGARPLAVTDCLNFANPEKPDNFWQFRRAVEGLADACEALGTPVISGNVSFYNETPEHAIFPTPTIGMVGLLDDATKRVTQDFKNDGDLIYLLSLGKPSFGGSEFLSRIHGREVGNPPALDLAQEERVQGLVRASIELGLLQSAHDLSDGGLAIALAESTLPTGHGAVITLPEDSQPHLTLFGERSASIVVSVAPSKNSGFLTLARTHDLVPQSIGSVSGEALSIAVGSETLISTSVVSLVEQFESAIPTAMSV